MENSRSFFHTWDIESEPAFDGIDVTNIIRTSDQELIQFGRISIAKQKELRAILSNKCIQPPCVQADLERLLNPRRAHIVSLTDEQFRKTYYAVSDDNYRPPHPRNIQDVRALFDANHGFYVATRMDLLL